MFLTGGSTALIVLRFLEGLGEGTTFPALSGKLIALFCHFQLFLNN